MPSKDGTGPKGEGSKTGRQMGNCEGRKPSEDSDDCRRDFKRRPRGCRRRTDECRGRN